MEEQTLFGAPTGLVSAVQVWAQYHPDSKRTSVDCTILQRNRREQLRLSVYVGEDQGLGAVIGSFVPLQGRTGSLSVKHARSTLWAIHDRLGRLGFEVEIRGCGKPRNT